MVKTVFSRGVTFTDFANRPNESIQFLFNKLAFYYLRCVSWPTINACGSASGTYRTPPSPKAAAPTELSLSLSKSLGGASIFSLRLGTRLVYVVSSHSVAEECFTKNDVVFANRLEFLFAKHIGYNSTTMVSAAYGDSWRNLRRIGAIEIFSSIRLDSFLSTRKDEIWRLILCLSKNPTSN